MKLGGVLQGSVGKVRKSSGGLTITGTNNRLVKMDGSSGIQDSGITIDDSDNVTGVNSLTTTGSVETASAATNKLGRAIEMDAGIGYSEFLRAAGGNLLQIQVDSIRFGATGVRLKLQNKALGDGSSIVEAAGGARSAVSPQKTIADDSIHSFDPGNDEGFIMIVDRTNGNAIYAFFDMSADSVTSLNLVGSAEVQSNDLTGTTGTDGNIALGVDTDNNELDLENRTGAPADFIYHVFT